MDLFMNVKMLIVGMLFVLCWFLLLVEVCSWILLIKLTLLLLMPHCLFWELVCLGCLLLVCILWISSPHLKIEAISPDCRLWLESLELLFKLLLGLCCTSLSIEMDLSIFSVLLVLWECLLLYLSTGEQRSFNK